MGRTSTARLLLRSEPHSRAATAGAAVDLPTWAGAHRSRRTEGTSVRLEVGKYPRGARPPPDWPGREASPGGLVGPGQTTCQNWPITCWATVGQEVVGQISKSFLEKFFGSGHPTANRPIGWPIPEIFSK